MAAVCNDLTGTRRLRDLVIRGVLPPRMLFVGLAYAGHRTRFLNLRKHVELDARICSSFVHVTGWQDQGLIERLPVLPGGVKGRMRALLQAAPLARFPRPDVIWSAATEVAVPYLWSQAGAWRRPLVHDTDCTFDQLENLAPVYFNRKPRQGVHRLLGRLNEAILWRSVSLFTPWSRWAADALRARHVSDDRIEVLPPGVDLQVWRAPIAPRTQTDGPLRLLFVGADFNRKGGPILSELVSSAQFRNRLELDIVTRDAICSRPGIRIHRAEANSPFLMQLYAQADLFVLPTRAECFGLAAVEAMASGLPAIVGDVGGTRDIVEHDVTGWLIQPTLPHLRDALERALAHRKRLPSMGERARQVAEQRFDGARNDGRLIELMLELDARHRSLRRV